jgi:N-acetylmuramoyl-L-alanine amidase
LLFYNFRKKTQILNNHGIQKIILSLFLFLGIFPFSESNQKFTVILDAGHGGKDPGNSYHGFVEKSCIKNYFKIRKYLKEILILLFTPENQMFL